MMNPLVDEEEVYVRKEGIDRTVGFLVASLSVVLVFMLLVVGMVHLQGMSEATTTSHRNNQVVKPSEIGDVTATQPNQ